MLISTKRAPKRGLHSNLNDAHTADAAAVRNYSGFTKKSPWASPHCSPVWPPCRPTADDIFLEAKTRQRSKWSPTLTHRSPDHISTVIYLVSNDRQSRGLNALAYRIFEVLLQTGAGSGD